MVQKKKTKKSKANLGKGKAVVAKPNKKPAIKPKPLVPEPPERTPRRVMVIVHGGGDIPENYFEGLVRGVKTQLGKPFDFLPAYYSDVITQHQFSIAAVESPEVAQLKAAYEKQLRDSHARAQAENQARGIVTTSFFGLDVAMQDTIKEVVVYLTNANAAQAVRDRLVATLDQAAQDFDEIILASHSLGTVVSFDVLKQAAHRYNIAYWFTMGCPLGKLIRIRSRDSGLGEISAQHIARWHNLFDTNDFVADAISTYLFADDFHVHDIFVEVAPSMPGAHDYFENPATHRMLAEVLK